VRVNNDVAQALVFTGMKRTAPASAAGIASRCTGVGP